MKMRLGDFSLILISIIGGFFLMASGASSAHGDNPDVAGWGLAIMIFVAAVSLISHRKNILVWTALAIELLLSLLYIAVKAGLIPANLPNNSVVLAVFIFVLLSTVFTPLVLFVGLVVNLIESFKTPAGNSSR